MKTSVPLYHRLKSDLIRDIQSNKWEIGEKIPSESELAVEHGVSRITVRQAIGDLVSMGYLIRHQGKGTYVAKQNRSVAVSRLQGFAEELRVAGKQVALAVKDVQAVACSERVSKRLDIPDTTEVIRISRIASVEGSPIFRETSFLVPPTPNAVDELGEDSEAHHSIYGFFERYGVRIAYGSQEIYAERANYGDRDELMVGFDEPILVICRLTFDHTGTPVEFSEVRYPSSRYQYRVNLTRSGEYLGAYVL
ncbi:GntR family transcriptional regulator [Alicyclobacillus acidiphilus]|uniref:GntR family transcriptional regulator n=1 Tax=Alicyclobacillus acidiphilus TaxID=182455 RepID=UPI0008357D73|nr:GntR family transcriptional regulator [Alicyclobacillus acidiphilus]